MKFKDIKKYLDLENFEPFYDVKYKISFKEKNYITKKDSIITRVVDEKDIILQECWNQIYITKLGILYPKDILYIQKIEY